MFSHVSDHTFYDRSLNDQSTILDLGANHGGFSSKMSRRYGGKYYLVEANPELAGKLANEGQFSISHCAVADKEGPIDFHIAVNHEGSSLLTLPEQSAVYNVLRETVVVQARTLKSLVDELGISQIDLIKMDIEGAEIGVLNTIDPELLERVKQITVEFHCAPMFGFHMEREVEAIIRRMEKLGFVSLDFSYPERTDVLFLNKRYHPLASPYVMGIRIKEFLRSGFRRTIRLLLPWDFRKKLRRIVSGPAPQEVS